MKKYLAEAIGTMVLVLMGCGVAVSLDCTSNDPALASIGPALFQGGAALEQLWIFIAGPFAGALLAAGIWKVLTCEKCAK